MVVVSAVASNFAPKWGPKRDYTRYSGDGRDWDSLATRGHGFPCFHARADFSAVVFAFGHSSECVRSSLLVSLTSPISALVGPVVAYTIAVTFSLNSSE